MPLKAETLKMTGKIKYEFSTQMWQHASPGGWHFISLPEKTATEIRVLFKSEEEGWGRLKAIAKIGNSEWKTAIWFDTKRNTYLLPVKAVIRQKEHLEIEKNIKLIVWI